MTKTKTVASKAHNSTSVSGKDKEEGKEQKNELVVGAEVNLPGTMNLSGELAGLADEIEASAGAGTSQKAEDNVLPFIYLLQSNSPACNPRGEDHIDGALPGHIWLKNAPIPIVDGEEGIVVQPCFFHKAIVEWPPRSEGGGSQAPVAQHEDMPPDAEQYEAEGTGAIRWRRKNGNTLQETRYHGVLVNGVPYIIGFSSTNNSVSKNWMQLMNQFKLRSGKVAPSWLRYYRLTTKMRRNAAGEWFVWSVQDLGPIGTAHEFHAGSDLNRMLATGEKIIGDPDDTLSGESASRTDNGSGSKSDQDPNMPF